jgi:uncharacterized metal-binding protein
MNCGDYKAYACLFNAKLPENCRMGDEEILEIYRSSLRSYMEDVGVRNLTLNAARVGSRDYLRWTRVEEIAEFARIGLREGKILGRTLRKNGFEVSSVEAICNPVPQAERFYKDWEEE